MHLIRHIINNQKKYKDDILSFFQNEYDKAKKMLYDIKCEDEFVNKEKEKLKKKLKKSIEEKHIKTLFFINSKRNKVFYVWWDEQNNEAKILTYGKR